MAPSDTGTSSTLSVYSVIGWPPVVSGTPNASVAESDVVPTTMYEFDFLITKSKLEDGEDFKDFLNDNSLATSEAYGDAGLRSLQQGDIIQVERRGFYRCDRPFINASKPLVLFMIPDGKSKSMSSLTTKLAHR